MHYDCKSDYLVSDAKSDFQLYAKPCYMYATIYSIALPRLLLLVVFCLNSICSVFGYFSSICCSSDSIFSLRSSLFFSSSDRYCLRFDCCRFDGLFQLQLFNCLLQYIGGCYRWNAMRSTLAHTHTDILWLSIIMHWFVWYILCISCYLFAWFQIFLYFMCVSAVRSVHQIRTDYSH